MVLGNGLALAHNFCGVRLQEFVGYFCGFGQPAYNIDGIETHLSF